MNLRKVADTHIKASEYHSCFDSINATGNFIMSSTTMPISFRVLNIISVFAMIGFLSACAEIEEKEQLMSAAGFSMKYADTPEKLDHLKVQEQHKIIPFIKDGKSYFVYADSTNCHCMYIGDDIAYQKFNNLQVQHDIANQQRISAEMNQEWEMNGGRWGQPWGNGPWNGYYY